MKVLMLLPDFPLNPYAVRSGVHAAVQNLLRGFNKCHQVEVQILTFTKLYSDQGIKFFGDIKVHYMWEGPFPFHLLNYLVWAIKKVKKLVNEIRPDIIHFQVGNGFLLIGLYLPNTLPKILTIHGILINEAKVKRRLIDRLTWYVNAWIGERLHISNIIHLSTFTQNYYQHPIVKQQVVIPNAISKVYYKKIDHSKKFTKKLLFIGQLDVNKNLGWLVDCMIELGNAHGFELIVAGGITDPIYYNDKVKKILENGISRKIHLVGWCDEDKKHDLFDHADILIVPSIHESYPMVILEAMAAGVIVMANTTGGIPEMISHEKSGMLFSLHNKKSFIKNILRLEKNETLRKYIRINAQNIVSKRNMDKRIAKQTIEFYKKVINE